MRTSIEIREADVWIPESVWVGYSHRRVVTVTGGVVAWSDGSDKNHLCKIETFRRFARPETLFFRRAD